MTVSATNSTQTQSIPEEDNVENGVQDSQSEAPDAPENNKNVTADGFYTQADLEAMGLDPKIAEYLVQDFAHNPGSDSPEVKGESLIRLERMGELDIKPGASGDTIEVPIIARNGYSLIELLATTNLTSEEASDLLIKKGDGFTISQSALDAETDGEGNLTARGRANSGDTVFNGNRVSNRSADAAIDSSAQFESADLVAMGLTQAVADFITQDGPVTGAQIKAMIQNDDLIAAKINGEIQLRVNGGDGQVPEDGASALMLIFLDMDPNEAAWLVDAYGDKNGKVSQEDLANKTVTQSDGSLSLNEEASAEYAGLSTDETTLTADGADYSDLVSLGLSSSQADYIIADFESEEGSGSISSEKMTELKAQGILVEDPAYSNPPRYMLGGEAGMPAPDAQAAAKSFANGAQPDVPVLEIAPDGTGNFFTAGSADSTPGGIDTQQSVIFSRGKNEAGERTGALTPNNGNTQGHFDKTMLLELGFTEDQATALFNDKGNPEVLTMTELRDAVSRDVGGSSSTAQISGQSIIMRAEGEPLIDEDAHTNPMAPTQQDAQWLNEEYGGGDGLTESELAVALEEGAVQMINGQVMMTAHGKAQAHMQFGPTGDSSLEEQQSHLRSAVRTMTANQTGTNRILDEKSLISIHNGNLSSADAQLILQTYGDGTSVSQDQLWDAIKNDELIISKIPADPTKQGSRDAFSLKITPKGYDSMADRILADPNHPLTIQTNGVLSYPEATGKTSINAEELMQNHGLEAKDAHLLVATHDKDSDGYLNQREMLAAIMAEDVKLDANNKITEVNITNKGDSIVGPYTYETLVGKIDSEKPPAEDIAKMLMLEHGLDPGNDSAQITDAQIEDWLRRNPIMQEDVNGKLSPIEQVEGAGATGDEVWTALNLGGGQLEIGFSRGSVLGGDMENTNLTFGEARTLGNYMVEELGMGEKTGHKGRNRRFTKEDVQKLVDEGILTVGENGKVSLTEHGHLTMKAHNAAQATRFFDTAENKGDAQTLSDGTRMINKAAFEDRSKYRQSEGEHWLSRQMRGGGHDPSEIDKRGAMTTGMYWAANEGIVRFEEFDDGTFQFEVNDRGWDGDKSSSSSM